jgi:hypothetical protein
VALSHVLHHFPTLMLMMSSLHLVIFKHGTHISLISLNTDFRNLALHFLHIYRVDFHLKKKKILQTLRRFYGVTSSSRYPLLEIIFYENQDGICFL